MLKTFSGSRTLWTISSICSSSSLFTIILHHIFSYTFDIAVCINLWHVGMMAHTIVSTPIVCPLLLHLYLLWTWLSVCRHTFSSNVKPEVKPKLFQNSRNCPRKWNQRNLGKAWHIHECLDPWSSVRRWTCQEDTKPPRCHWHVHHARVVWAGWNHRRGKRCVLRLKIWKNNIGNQLPVIKSRINPKNSRIM